MSLGDSFSDLASKTGESLLQKTGLGKLTGAIDRLRGKAKKGASNTPEPYQGAQFAGEKDFRAMIKVPLSYVNAPSVYMGGVVPYLGGVLFPYTPTISQEMSASYNTLNPTHSNYALHFYKNSSAGPITVTGKFSVQNSEDAYFWIATTHLLRSLTKMRFGDDPGAGTPPPVCRFSAYGPYQYQNVPVVIQSFKVDLPDGVDYFVTPSVTTDSAQSPGTAVPVLSSITVVLLPMYSRRELLGQKQVDDYLIAGQNLRNRGFL
jgi:hypothetical protein